jgi:ATP-binding cassette, subfamily B (MDR/TAP), member 1
MLKQRVAFFDSSSNSSRSLLSRLATDPESLKSLAGPNIGVIIVVGVSVLSALILSLAVDWKLALVAIFGAFPFIFGAGFLHEAMENSFEERASRTFADSVGFAGECIQAIKTVSSLRMEGVVETKFGLMLEEHCRRASKHILTTMIWFSLSEAIDMLCMGLTFWYGGHQLSHHESTTTQFFVVFVAIVLGAQSMGQFFAHSSDVSKGISARRAIYAMRQGEPENSKKTQKILEKEDPSSDAPIIKFRDAVFSYLTRPTPVLRGLNLTLHRGQFIAIVGPSGSGKSTIVGLLERFYDLTGGQLSIDGVDSSTLDTDCTRRRLALVSQEPTLYSGTTKENVLLGTDVDVSLDELESIARQAQIHDLILSLPEGWDTQVGARGTALSGGQKQRIAIARALARRSEVLLLDEALVRWIRRARAWYRRP